MLSDLPSALPEDDTAGAAPTPLRVLHLFGSASADVLARRISDGQVEAQVARPYARAFTYGPDTADLFERATDTIYPNGGDTSLPPVIREGWRTYNFEVEEFHTYIAGGFRVHNTSLLDLIPNDASDIHAADTDGDGKLDTATYDRPGGVKELLHGRDLNNDGNTDRVDRTITVPREGLLGPGDKVRWEEFYERDNATPTSKTIVGIDYAPGSLQGEEVGRTLGSVLGSAIGGQNIFAQVGSATIAATLLQNVGEFLHKGIDLSILATDGHPVTPLEVAVTDTFSDLGQDLVGNARIQVNNALSSVLVGEIADALNLQGFERGVFSTVGNTVTNQVLGNIANMLGHPIPGTVVDANVNLLSGFNTASMVSNLANSLGGYFGSQLGTLAINPHNQQAALFGSATAAIGSYVGGTLASATLATAFSVIPVIGTLIGAFAGQALGDLLGNAFFDDDRIAQYTLFTDSNGKVQYGYPFTKDGANLELPRYIASTTADTLNKFFDQFGTNIGLGQSFPNFTVGWYVDKDNHKQMYAVNQQYQAAYNIQEARGIIAAAINYAAANSEIGGSDIVLRRAYHVSHGHGLAELSFDLQVAKDFEKYQTNTSLINTLIADAPTSAFSAGWIATLERARELGLQYAADFNAMEYLASYADLRQAFGSDREATTRHFINNGLDEGRRITFNSYEYLAANPTLAQALGGANRDTAADHYIRFGQSEGRATHFDSLSYIAANGDLIEAFGRAKLDDAAKHYAEHGYAEGRAVNFDYLQYLAANPGLAQQLGGINSQTATQHYISSGYFEHRSVSFDYLAYYAANPGLFEHLGTRSADAAERHYISQGYAEGRSTVFNSLAYIASYSDLITSVGTSAFRGEIHYLDFGQAEGRYTTFDASSYLESNPDLKQVFGTNLTAATEHYIKYGYYEGRSSGSIVSNNSGTAVSLMYRGLLGREPDGAGLTANLYRVSSGTALANLFGESIGSDEYEARSTGYDDNQFLATLYQRNFGRGVDQNASSVFKAQMTGVSGRLSIALAVVSSEEFRNFYSGMTNSAYISAIYSNVLGRAADSGGQAVWTARLNNGSYSRADVATGFVNSAEFTGRYIQVDNTTFVDQIYHNALGRASDTSVWEARLQAGMTRAEIAYQISESAEAHTYLATQWRGWHQKVAQGATSQNITGNEGANTLSSGDGNDILTGGAGNDTYYVNSVGDRVIEAAGGGVDTVYTSVDYALEPGQEIEVLRANAGASGLNLSGNEFANVLYSGGGDDILAGRAGNDTYYVNSANDRVIEAVGEGSDTIYTSVSFALEVGQEIEYLRANAGSTGLTLTGNALANVLISGAGNDLLIGGSGDDTYNVNNVADQVIEATGGGRDTVFASVSYTLGAGQDIEVLRANAGSASLTLTGNELANTLYSGGGDDVLAGGIGNDIYYVNSVGDQVVEGAGGGSDTVYASVSYTLGAGQEVEFLTANAGSTGIRLTGNAFANTLISGAGNDVLIGGAGNDTYNVNNSADGIVEAVGGGTDSVYTSVDFMLGAGQEIESLFANAGNTGLTLTGNEYANRIVGGNGNDHLYGGAGNDTLEGRGGDDTLEGGTGNDLYYLDSSKDQIVEAVGAGTDTVYAGVDYALAAGQEIEYLRANAGWTGLTLAGNEFANTIYGGNGVDTLIGGAGNDTYYVNNTEDVVKEAAGGGTDSVYASVNYTLAAGQEIEGLRANAGTTSLTLTGNEFANSLVSGAGSDVLIGGAGNDTYNVNSADDQIIEQTAGGTDTVFTSVSYVLAAGQEIEILRASAGALDLTLTGNEFANTFYSGAGNDTLIGGAGNDTYWVNNTGDVVQEAAGGGSDNIYTSANFTLGAGQEIEFLRANAGTTGLTLTGNELANNLISGAGNDTLIGGAGNDTYNVNSAGDQVIEQAGGGTDTVYASVSYTLGAGQEIESLRANSGSTGLALTGNANGNTIVGGAGNDVIAGGGGYDTLRGNGGSDIFVFKALSDSVVGGTRVIIADMTVGTDRIDLSAIQAVSGASNDQAFSFIGTGAFTKHAGELHQIASGSTTIVEGDADGDGTADFQIGLTGTITLQAGDFIL